jgi:hypothetical protein
MSREKYMDSHVSMSHLLAKAAPQIQAEILCDVKNKFNLDIKELLNLISK